MMPQNVHLGLSMEWYPSLIVPGCCRMFTSVCEQGMVSLLIPGVFPYTSWFFYYANFGFGWFAEEPVKYSLVVIMVSMVNTALPMGEEACIS